jgi:hypothetical protein
MFGRAERSWERSERKLEGRNMQIENYKRPAGAGVRLLVLSSAVLLLCFQSEGQFGTPFSSGSTGVDGALNITAPGVTYFNPAAMNLTKNTNIFNFTTITIAAGSTLKFWEGVFRGPVFLLASGDVTINGSIDINGDSGPGPTATGAQQGISFPGSGGYSGGMGGIHGDANHAALPGNGPGGGAAGDINAGAATPQAVGGTFTGNAFLVPLIGGSGGGGTNDNGQWGGQGGSGGGAILIASSTKITLDSQGKGGANGYIEARGGYATRGCGGSGGAVRLVSNTITGANSFGIYVDTLGGQDCKIAPGNGLARIEAQNTNFGAGNVTGSSLFSVPFALNLPTAPLPVISVTSIGGIAINANPFSFPDATINSSAPVPVVINATNVPLTSAVNMYLVSDSGPNQTIPVKLTGTNQASTATVNVTFPAVGTRGLVKAVFQ